MTPLETLALRMAKARRTKLAQRKTLKAITGLEEQSIAMTERAIFALRAARIEWRKASAAMWRLAEKMEKRSE